MSAVERRTGASTNFYSNFSIVLKVLRRCHRRHFVDDSTSVPKCVYSTRVTSCICGVKRRTMTYKNGCAMPLSVGNVVTRKRCVPLDENEAMEFQPYGNFLFILISSNFHFPSFGLSAECAPTCVCLHNQIFFRLSYSFRYFFPPFWFEIFFFYVLMMLLPLLLCDGCPPFECSTSCSHCNVYSTCGAMKRRWCYYVQRNREKCRCHFTH